MRKLTIVYSSFKEWIGCCRDRVDNKRPRDGAAHGDPIERSIVTHRHHVYNEDSKEEDEYEPHEFPRHQRQGEYGRRADVERFFGYMETAPKRRVKVVACRLKGGASAWWVKIVEVHKEVKLKLEEANKKYKEAIDKHKRKQVFEVGDKVMVFLRHERFLVGFYSKLQLKKYGPYEIVKRINDNAYVVDFPNSVGISFTFNVANLYPYHSMDEPLHPLDDSNSRSCSFKVEETDVECIIDNFIEKWEKVQRKKQRKHSRVKTGEKQQV
ncbi:hypothetical protein GH714_000103 [Hevea brasiliensis]|uniref:Tf2-1-like SH3-like domain-containing protein n=1 Tax=Hevea brasiliensis TaxID=3981 RepID=A0A6A6LF26_HEVBR|nr:hypothetical protein GH714_000103 [Hevea brasiliensis]